MKIDTKIKLFLDGYINLHPVTEKVNELLVKKFIDVGITKANGEKITSDFRGFPYHVYCMR